MAKSFLEKVKEMAEEGKIHGGRVTAEDFCSVCGKPEDNMYIFDGEKDIPPHCEDCFSNR